MRRGDASALSNVAKSAATKGSCRQQCRRRGFAHGNDGRVLAVETQLVDTLSQAEISERSCEWVHHVLNLLYAAVRQLRADEAAAQVTILQATSVLRRQMGPEGVRPRPEGKGRLLAWQVRKLRDFIEARLSDPICVSDLCALVRLSEAHFSRAFKRTFGESPHAFVVRRRVEMAARCMLQTDASLCDIAQRFGFTDQAHLCKHFRQAVGETPAAWRREQRSYQDSNGTGQVGLLVAGDGSVAVRGIFKA